MASILVIDDDPDVLSFLSGVIGDDGHSVSTAANGLIATTMHDIASIDLVVTDLFMPEREGLETIAAIRRSNPATQILAISGQREYLGMATSLGADAALSKPFSAAVMLATIDDLLSDR